MGLHDIVGVVKQTGFETYVYFKNGFLEKVYENALANRLRKKGLNVAQQRSLHVNDEDGTRVGEYFADLLIKYQLIIELKVARTLEDIHDDQVLAYLKAAGLKHGMLINLGAPKFEARKFIL